MIKAVEIKMHTGKENSNSLTEIDSIHLTGVSKNDFYKKEDVHDFIKNNPNSPIEVDVHPYPRLEAVDNGNQKYVRSKANKFGHDNLLELPRK